MSIKNAPQHRCQKESEMGQRETMEISSCMYSSLFFTLPQKKVSRAPHSDQTYSAHRGRKATSNSLRTMAERKGLMVFASFISDCMYVCAVMKAYGQDIRVRAIAALYSLSTICVGSHHI